MNFFNQPNVKNEKCIYITGLEPKKVEVEEKYIPVNVRMRRTQVSWFYILCFNNKLKQGRFN